MADPVNPWEPTGELGSNWTGNPWSPLTDPDEIGKKVWQNFVTASKNGDQATYMAAAGQNWGVEAYRWRLELSEAYKPYRKVYGFIYLAAEKRGMRPEFIHAVIFGEGLGDYIKKNRVDLEIPYSDTAPINSFDNLGLDQIGSRLEMLISRGYLDKKYRDSYWQPEHMVGVPNELHGSTNAGIITGYEAAVEMVAAELQCRGDYMMEVARKNGVLVETQVQKEFLMYAKYVSRSNAENDLTSTEALRENCSRWDLAIDGPKPNNPVDPKYYRYAALVRMAATEWLVNAGTYHI
jgi:hypothetical protein